jgi:hypothetical protein
VERLPCAHLLIQKARDLPIPSEGAKKNFSKIAQVKALLQDTHDLVKFIPKTSSATVEVKEQVSQIFIEADWVNQEILH